MSSPSINVLLIEDNPVQARVLRAVLEKSGKSVLMDAPAYNLVCATTLNQGLSRLNEGSVDIVLLDLSLPDSHGLETLVQLREQEADVPIVVLTGINDESLAVAAVKAGAQDYLMKGQTDSQLITRSIRYSIERHRLLRSLSLVDELTGLYNRRGFRTLSEQQLKVAHRAEKDCLLFYIDLDGLKSINDTFGHGQGSQAIIDAAGVFRQSFRDSDIIARLGGDEFVALVVNTDVGHGNSIKSRLQQNLDAHNSGAARPYRLALSLGIARYNHQQPLTLDALIHKADEAMYRQKRLNKLAPAQLADATADKSELATTT